MYVICIYFTILLPFVIHTQYYKHKYDTSPTNQPPSPLQSMKRTPIPFSENEAHEIQARLDAKLDASHLSYRPAAQGTVAYLEGWKAIGLANEVFGFNGWSSEILNFTTDFVKAGFRNISFMYFRLRWMRMERFQ